VLQRERTATQYERLLSRGVRLTREPQFARRLLSRNPYDEDAYAALIESELSAGKPFNAMRIVDQCRSALAEIGIQPSEAFFSRFGDLSHEHRSRP
jgi:DNA-binding SARP family transcriptional activator